jgi:hypothetical protein
MISEDYDGPVSGGFVLGPDGMTEHRSFTQKEDPVLTKDENAAVAWFRALPPNKQLREVQRLKWNLDHWSKEAEAWKKSSQRLQVELDQLKAKLATFTPDGFTFPPAAKDLLDHATAHGWKTGRSWHVDKEDPTVASLRLAIAHDGWIFDHLGWTCGQDGSGRMTSRGIVREPHRDWYDAPSLKKIKQIITDNSDH